MTNRPDLPPLRIAELHRGRWQMEPFFKLLNQKLKIKASYGISTNAVLIQIWTRLMAYLLLVWLKLKSKASGGFLEITRLARTVLLERLNLWARLCPGPPEPETSPDFQFPCRTLMNKRVLQQPAGRSKRAWVGLPTFRIFLFTTAKLPMGNGRNLVTAGPRRSVFVFLPHIVPQPRLLVLEIKIDLRPQELGLRHVKLVLMPVTWGEERKLNRKDPRGGGSARAPSPPLGCSGFTAR